MDEKRIHIGGWKHCIVHPGHLSRLKARSQGRAFLGWKSSPSMESAKSWLPLDTATVLSMNISPQCVARWSISVPDALNQPFNSEEGAAKDCCRITSKSAR